MGVREYTFYLPNYTLTVIELQAGEWYIRQVTFEDAKRVIISRKSKDRLQLAKETRPKRKTMIYYTEK